MENSGTLKRSSTEPNTQSDANPNNTETQTQAERGKRRKQRTGTKVTGAELDLFHATFSPKTLQYIVTVPVSAFADSSLCLDILVEIIRNSCKLFRNFKEFKSSILSLSLVCKDFHLFIKNQFLTVEKFTFFVQEDFFANQKSEPDSKKLTKACPIQNLQIIFPKEFRIQLYPAIKFNRIFPNLKKVELYINYIYVLPEGGPEPKDTLTYLKKLDYLPESYIYFGPEIDHSELKITLSGQLAEGNIVDPKIVDPSEFPHKLAPFYQIWITSGNFPPKEEEKEETDKRVSHPCLCFQEFPPEDLKEGYGGWTKYSLRMVIDQQHYLEEMIAYLYEGKIIKTWENAIKIFGQRKKELLIFDRKRLHTISPPNL